MTQWVENPTGGRDRGLQGLLRAWVEVMFRPRRFFRNGVAPGDQAPGLIFAVSVVLVEELVRFALVADAYPAVSGVAALDGLLWLGVAALLVAPAALHLVAALQTVLLAATFVRDRAGISETVQVLAYATAPCVFAGVPVPEVRAVCGLYGFVLLLVGMGQLHGITRGLQAVLATAVPGSIVFGYGFRAFHAIGVLLRRWYII